MTPRKFFGQLASILQPYLRPLVGLLIVALALQTHHAYRELERRVGEIEIGDYNPVQAVRGRIARGDRLVDTLREQDIPPKTAEQVIAALRGVLDPRKIRAGDRFMIEVSTAGEFMHLTLERERQRFVVARKGSEGLRASMAALPIVRTMQGRGGRVRSSLWESMSSEGIPPSVIDEFENIFRFTLDFLTETRNGDSYAVLWEESRATSGALIDTQIVAALYEGGAARSNTALLYDGQYWSGTGDSLNRMFLAAPLTRYRITSRFSLRRFHPIHRIWRPHMGIDYAAPRGTPIISIGQGTVSFVGWKGGFGRTVMVKHANHYETLYGHMSRYAPGLRQGLHVRQGQVLGYVGDSGHATGPHLDFRISLRGKWMNFLAMRIPPFKKISPQDAPAFESLKSERLKSLRSLSGQPSMIKG